MPGSLAATQSSALLESVKHDFREGILTTGQVGKQLREGALDQKSGEAIHLENRHTGERLALRRVERGDEIWLELKGSLPAHSQGPPMHVHYVENEEGHVI